MINFKINGEERKYEGDPERKLLDYLRNVEKIKSPKDGCSSQGACGSCTVILDKRAILSCMTPMSAVEGKEILSLEGIPQTRREILAKAFVVAGAVQCGFCTPAIIARTEVLLQNNPDPTLKDINKALKPHLCRCTGYTKIRDAVLLAAKAFKEGKEIFESEEKGVGKSQKKYRGIEKALGEFPFIDDMEFDGMLFGALKYSDHPRAKIISINTDKAENLEGVERIIRKIDIPGNTIAGLIYKDWPVMVDEGETTNYIGDVLATVIAVDEVTAREAVSLIEVEYEVLTPVTDMTEALKIDSPQVHKKGNLLDHTHLVRGNAIEKVFENSDFTVDGNFETQVIEHAFMEPEVCIALKEENGSIRLYSHSQGPYEDRRQLKDILNLPEDMMKVTQVSAGGGFGGKEDLTVQAHGCLGALLTGKPVKVKLRREESIRMHPKRHPIRIKMKLSCNKNGDLTGAKVEAIGDTGAYASVGTKVLQRVLGHATGVYKFQNVDIDIKTVYTNNIPCGAMRGFGANQVIFALESLIDELAEKGKFDLWQFRYDNAISNGDALGTGEIIDSGVGIKETLLAVKDDFQNAKYAGIACGLKNTGVGNGLKDPSRVKISFVSPEEIILQHGWTEMGQGINTVAIQVLFEETGLDPEVVKIRVNTEDGVETWMTTSSRATTLLGNSIIDVSKKINEALKTQTIEDLVGKTFSGYWEADPTLSPEKLGEGNIERVHYSYSYATQVVILDDEGKIEKVIAAHDGGRVLNPIQFEGQIEGALHMGVGYALTEALEMENGFPKSFKLKDCQILRIDETPEFVVKAVEVKDERGPYGAKGIGEVGLVPTAGAVANAIYSFTGIRHRKLPIARK